MTGAFVTSSGEEHRGFHQSPNVLRDLYMPLIGVDGYGFVQYLMSWANTNAQLPQRRMKKDLNISQDKLERIQQLVLAHCGHFVQFIPGDRVKANRWHLDMRRVWGENAAHMAQMLLQREAKAGVPEIGTQRKRPPEGVPEIGTQEKRPPLGVPEIGTGCTGNRYAGVPISGTFKDIKYTLKNSGGFSSTENARVDSQPVPHAPPAPVIDLPVPTTENASLSEARPVVTADGPSVAGAPDGANPDALVITDEDLEFLFGAGEDNAGGLDTVPGAAALAEPAVDVPEAVVLPALEEIPAPAIPLDAPVLDVVTSAARPVFLPPLPVPPARIVSVDDLPAIPEAELQGRPVAVPSDGKYKTIVGMVGGKNVIADGILESSSPSGGVPRVNWLRLNDDELALVRSTAQAEAKRTEKSFLSLCILGLDRLIGAPKRTKTTEIVMNGKASVLVTPGALTPPPPDPATGRTLLGRWASRGNPAHIVEVIEIGIVEQGSRKQMRAILADGSSLSAADLVVRHTLLAAS